MASASLLDLANTLAAIPLVLILRTASAMVPVLSRWAMPRFLRCIDGQGADRSTIPRAG